MLEFKSFSSLVEDINNPAFSHMPGEGDQVRIIDPKLKDSPGYGELVVLTRADRTPLFTVFDYKVMRTGQEILSSLTISHCPRQRLKEIELVHESQLVDL